MSNKQTLQNYNNNLIKNNDELQTVINMINNLPDAGSGAKKLKYTTLEYIEHDDTINQWLQTNYKPGSNTRVLAKFTRKINTSWLENGTVVGSYKNSSSNFMFCYRSNSGSYENRLELYYGTESKLFYNVSNTDFKIDLNKNKWSIYSFSDSLLYSHTFSNTTFETAYETPVMASMANGNIGNLAWGRLYYIQIYDGDTLLYDIIPVKDAEGVVCGYDKVSNTFMYNQGTGSFIAGAELEKVYEDVEIEDISEELTNYDSKLKKQEITLSDIVDALRHKKAGNGNSSNIFIQDTEPETKNGVWIKDSNINVNLVQILSKTLSPAVGNWNDTSNYEQLPYDFYLGITASIGQYVYIFFNTTSSGVNALYRYDSINNTYTQLKDAPLDTNRGVGNVIGTDIYLFGSQATANKKAYKYNTLTDEYTAIADTPINFGNATSAAYGDSIYIFGGAEAADATYKYNTKTNTYTKLANMAVGSTAGRAVTSGDNIYVFGAGGYIDINKYNVPTNTHSAMKSKPAQNIGRCVPIAYGNYIFTFGSSVNDTAAQYIYMFDTTTDKITELSVRVPYKFGQGGAEFVNNKIYFFGSKFADVMRRVQTVDISTSIPLEEDTLLLFSGSSDTYNVMLVDDTVKTTFNSMLLYLRHKGLLKTDSVTIYYGNGETWTQVAGPTT